MRVNQLKSKFGTTMQGPLLFTPQVFPDERGFFLESWNKLDFCGLLETDGQVAMEFVQDNHSHSIRGVLRGLHYQVAPCPQAKLVRCVVGEIYDVAVDLRLHSPTYGQWVSANLSAFNYQQLWLPVGFAHGFLTLSSEAEVLYKTTGLWSRECEQSIRWSDPDLAIDWPMLQGNMKPIVSNKDAISPFLRDQLCVF